MQIKPGKWRMRNGECAVVEFRTESKVDVPWIGYDPMTHTLLIWSDEGRFRPWDTAESRLDLIEPWADKPAVDWSAMPAWAKWVAMEECGNWMWFSDKPELMEREGWWLNLKPGRGNNGSIPDSFAPSFTGNWRDSLVERPAQVGTI